MTMRIGVFCMAFACSACDALVPGDYAGSPVLRIQGLASPSVGDATIIRDGVLAAAVWQDESADGAARFSRLALDLEFPLFTIEMLKLPGPDVEFSVADGEPAIAEAYLHIVEEDTGPQPALADFLATDFEHALVYVSASPSEGSLTSEYLGGRLAPGFHVMDRTPVDTLTPAQLSLVARCAAAATDLPPSQAEASCAARRLYRLGLARDDLRTVLDFRPETASGR